MQNAKLIQSRKQRQNLKRAKFTTGDLTFDIAKVSKCSDKLCDTCKLIAEGSQIIINESNKTIFNIKKNMDCGVGDVIYMITCIGSGERYIGELGETL